MNKDDRYLEGLIEDKIERCRSRYSPEYTTFLDAHQQSVARKLVNRTAAGDVNLCFFGGYDDAERVVFMALPDYITAEEAAPFALIRATCREGGRPLTHRDYLGQNGSFARPGASFGVDDSREEGHRRKGHSGFPSPRQRGGFGLRAFPDKGCRGREEGNSVCGQHRSRKARHAG